MTRRYRLAFLGIALVVLLVVGLLATGSLAFLTNDFWFTAGLLLLVTLSLIDQPHFSKDSNIFINCITAALSLLLVPADRRDLLFWAFLVAVLYLLISSYALMILRNKKLGEEPRPIQLLSRANRFLGQPEILFSAFFLWGAVKQFGSDSAQFSALFWYWVVFMILNTPKAASLIEGLLQKETYQNGGQEIGEIIAIKSKNEYLAKIENDDILDDPTFVEFSTTNKDGHRLGYITKFSLLHDEKWAHIYSPDRGLSLSKANNRNIKPGIVYLTEVESPKAFLDRFIGIVAPGTTVSELCFAYEGKASVVVGDLLEVTLRDDKVIYQVTDARIDNDSLKGGDEDKATLGKAMQLGIWNESQYRFDSCGWVPNPSEAVMRAVGTDSVPVLSDDEMVIGSIPDSGYPVIMNKTTAVTHHLAILGVTGTGKSHFARNLIRNLASNDLKVIVVDLTGEYIQFFPDLCSVISPEDSKVSFKAIEALAEETSKFANQQKKEVIGESEKKLKESFYNSIKTFLEGPEQKGVFEIPDISNKSSIFEYVRWFFWVLFETAKTKSSFGKRVCVVLEEAHTVVPEYGSMGTSDNASKASVNSIAQIALQGRKYNIGLVVIAQRTANVSKTILTQCNSIIAFQEFDKTSTDFLSNYMGPSHLRALSSLKFRNGIAVGKAFKSTVPMLFEVPFENDDPKQPGTIPSVDDDIPENA